jgi:hypothetical protein
VVSALTLAISPLTGCRGDDDAADAGETGPDGDGDSEGSSGASSGGGSVDVGDFSIPAPDGLLLDALADAGIAMDSQRQLFYENDDFDRIVAFYDEWTGQNGEWSRSKAEGSVLLQDISGGALQMISITPDPDPGAQADGPVTFVLLVTDQ